MRAGGIVAVLVTTAIALSGCAGSVAPSEAAFRIPPGQWLDDVLRGAKAAEPDLRLLTAPRTASTPPLGVPRARLNELLAQAPAAPSAEEAVAIQRLSARLAADGVVSAAQATDEKLPSQARTALDQAIVPYASSIPARTEDGRSLRDVIADAGTGIGRDVVKDLACGQVLDLMQPEEQNAAAQAGIPSQRLIRLPRIEPETGDTEESYQAKVTLALANAVTSYLAARTGPRVSEYVNHYIWATGLIKDANDITSATEGVINYPDAARTQAFYNYMVICQSRPRS